jgi:hypothetical protein
VPNTVALWRIFVLPSRATPMQPTSASPSTATQVTMSGARARPRTISAGRLVTSSSSDAPNAIGSAASPCRRSAT